MYLILVVAFAAVIIAALVITRAVRRYRRNWLIRNWLKEYENARHRGRLLDLEDAPSGPWDTWQEIILARQNVTQAKEKAEAERRAREEKRAQQRAELQARLAALRKRIEGLHVSPLPAEDYKELLDLRWQVDGDDREWVKGHIKRLADERAHSLLTRGRDGDRQAFLELWDFVLSTPEYRNDTNEQFDLPEDWDELVARFIENPRLKDFGVERTTLVTGECRLLAAEALRENSLVLGKLVLAFCNEKYWLHNERVYAYTWREEVPDGLLTEVTKMVERLNHELGLTAEAATN